MDRCWCGEDGYTVAYDGLIRDGAFPRFVHGQILECKRCNTRRLEDRLHLDPIDYENGRYRHHIGEDLDPVKYLCRHRDLQTNRIEYLGVETFRDKSVIDYGAGAGAFLNALDGVASHRAAIEPCTAYHEFLRDTGIDLVDWHDFPLPKFDIAVCFETIEHIEDPITFLEHCWAHLRPGGELILSTPYENNLWRDVPYFLPCWYRTQHNWYFDEDTLALVANRAEIQVKEIALTGKGEETLWLRATKSLNS